MISREYDLLGYTALSYMSGNPKELAAETRRTMSQKALVAWIYDPLVARGVSLACDFTFGRGVPQPTANDKEVQELLEEFWSDRDNQIILTKPSAQIALLTDLLLADNVFVLIFDDGDDGKVKVGLLNADAVEEVVEDPEFRQRVLYYVARERKRHWDYKTARYVPDQLAKTLDPTYYEHYANVKSLEEDGVKVEKPPAKLVGDGKVFHIAMNRTTEMHFGVPELTRVIRWATAYNDFLAARVDMMKAAAAFIMKRTAKATPAQLAKLATRAVSRASPLAATVDPMYQVGGRAAAIINENEQVKTEPFRLDTGSAQAQQDGNMLHSQIATGMGWPTPYLGVNDSNLATMTALELPVLKRIESLQERFEELFRLLFDTVIQRALDSGKLTKEAPPKEDKLDVERSLSFAQAHVEEITAALLDGVEVEEGLRELFAGRLRAKLVEAVEDEADQEEDTERDLSYEFSMPSPLRRMMSDLVTSITGIAQTFDPNNTNTELSRVLLAIALGEGLEVDDPAAVVERVFPEGYQDPLLKMQMEQAQQPQPGMPGAPPGNMFGPQGGGGANMFGPPPGQGGDQSPAGGGQSYGAPMRSRTPEQAMQQGLVLKRRDGQIRLLREVEDPAPRKQRPDEDELVAVQVRGRSVGLDALFDSEVGQAALDALNGLTTGTNGTNGTGQE